MLLFLWLSNLAQAQTWFAHTPPFGDTIGIAGLKTVNEDVIWALGNRYVSDDTSYGYSPSATWVALTTDRGASWSVSQVDFGGIPIPGSLTAVDANTAYVTGLKFDNNTGTFGNTSTFRTIDGGQTWTLAPVSWDAVVSWSNFIHSVSAEKTLVFGDPRDDEFEIYATENGGDTWTRISGTALPDPLPGEYGSFGVGDGTGNHLWFGTSAGRVFHTADAGVTWEAAQTELPYLLGLSFSDSLFGVVFTQLDFFTQRLLHTSNGGDTWTEITPEGIKRIIGMEYIPNSPYILIGITNGGTQSGPFSTWISPDRGGSWQQISNGEIIGWPSFINGSVGWAGEYQQYDHPTRLYEYTGSPLVGLFAPNQLAADVTLSPNPASNVLRITVQAQESGDYWVLLNDAQGRLLKKETVSGVSEFEKTWDIQNLPAGSYTVTVTGGKGSVAQRLVKQ